MRQARPHGLRRRGSSWPRSDDGIRGPTRLRAQRANDNGLARRAPTSRRDGVGGSVCSRVVPW